MGLCQLGRALGLKVLGTAGTPEGIKLILNNGAHLAYNHKEKGYTDKIMVNTHVHSQPVVAPEEKKLVLNEAHQLFDHLSLLSYL